MGHSHIRLLATVGVAAFALAACGSSSKASSPPATTAPTVAPATTVAPDTTAPASTAAASVTVATTSLGKVLVDSNGMTLYRFDADTSPGVSTCTTGVCASTWPAAKVTGTAVAGTGVTASKLSSFKLADGSSQLEMDGHPLYNFKGDTKAGDTNGEGILSKWWAVTPDGASVPKP